MFCIKTDGAGWDITRQKFEMKKIMLLFSMMMLCFAFSANAQYNNSSSNSNTSNNNTSNTNSSNVSSSERECTTVKASAYGNGFSTKTCTTTHQDGSKTTTTTTCTTYGAEGSALGGVKAGVTREKCLETTTTTPAKKE